MSVYKDMAHDAGARGEEAEQLAQVMRPITAQRLRREA
ncbi:hypothetical protein LCGC14_2215820 [marine sediment metagenome]|uniref:Uncharacterized protein n=1 Tax=marine sediment metagenome TaxID=412755 RepID=A0A0F9DCD4_9ZZZZ